MAEGEAIYVGPQTGIGFGMIGHDVVDDERLSGVDICVYVALLRFTNVGGTCFPKIETIAKKARHGKTSVKEALARLVEWGYVVRKKRFNPDGTPTSNEYCVVGFQRRVEKREEAEEGEERISSPVALPAGGEASSPEEEKTESRSPEMDPVQYEKIIAHLNDRVKAKFNAGTKGTRHLIAARWKEGYRLEDFKKVINGQAALWLRDPKMIAYLRPVTLFGNKFEGYLMAALAKERRREDEDRRGESPVSLFIKGDRGGRQEASGSEGRRVPEWIQGDAGVRQENPPQLLGSERDPRGYGGREAGGARRAVSDMREDVRDEGGE